MVECAVLYLLNKACSLLTSVSAGSSYYEDGAVHLLLIGNALGSVFSSSKLSRDVVCGCGGYLFSLVQPVCRGYASSELVQVVEYILCLTLVPTNRDV